MEKIRVFTAFSGYDSQCLSLDRLKKKYPEFDYELVGWSEIDKYAIQAHNAIYPQWADRNYGDISKINWDEVPDFDLFTYSSPCQDFSNAGLQKGGEEGSGTRSSLLWECRRAIVAKKPKFLLMENVAALVSQKFIKTFNKWQEELARYGYTNFAQVLNAKDYGIPQNRERIFLVSVLGEAWYNFPQPFKLEKRLKDVLETNVDEKYYLSEKMIDYFNRVNEDKTHGHNFTPKDGADVAFTIRTAPGQRVDDNFVKVEGSVSNSQNSRVINPDGISYAMANGEKDGAPKIVEQCDTSFFNTQEE
jgi:DNA (cytosine-5)-methyltransferase 1